MNPSSNCSWTLRRLLKIEVVARSFVSYSVGNGCDTFLQLDIFYPLGLLIVVHGPLIACNADTSIAAKVSINIEDGNWLLLSRTP